MGTPLRRIGRPAFITCIMLIGFAYVAQSEPTYLTPEQTQAMRRPLEYPGEVPGAETEIYKSIGGVRLQAFILNPEGWSARDRRPAVVFFFGGGWRDGTPTQFLVQAAYLASRGMVAVLADYRVQSRHDVLAVDCVRDAKSAIRWVRANAERLGIDPERIVASGGSAGGHLAACAGLIEDFEEPGEDEAVSSRPNAMVLFNPVLVLAPAGGLRFDRLRAAGLAARTGVPPERLSPYHHIASGAPPCLIFHGKADERVPYESAEAFARAMAEAGNDCELLGYEGKAHGFFNYREDDTAMFEATMREMDRFLVELGYLEGVERVGEFLRGGGEP